MSAYFQVTKFIEELSTCSGIFLFEHKRLAEIDEQQLKSTLLLVDEVDILLANPELKARALRARTIIGLSATLGGATGLQRYSDHFSQAAFYSWIMPGVEESIDFKLLKWSTWEKGPKGDELPYS